MHISVWKSTPSDSVNFFNTSLEPEMKLVRKSQHQPKKCLMDKKFKTEMDDENCEVLGKVLDKLTNL